MSRKDTYHELVKNTLSQEGWIITHDPYIFETDPKLSTDLGAERLIAAERGIEKIAVEIKSFVTESQVVELEKAVGQYGIYAELLKTQEADRTLFLAVPTTAFENILSRQVGKIAVQRFCIKLIIYSIAKKEPLIWKIP
ncbi:hypothetical protein TI05_11005 [Achromatium sp. WMS3]|nr:hypothetical protein TI05_11005 [Achromatium sp. WMS3]